MGSECYVPKVATCPASPKTSNLFYNRTASPTIPPSAAIIDPGTTLLSPALSDDPVVLPVAADAAVPVAEPVVELPNSSLVSLAMTLESAEI